MYTPPLFSERDPQVIKEFIDRHPLATLVGIADGKPTVDHIPFMRIDGSDTGPGSLGVGSKLIAHVAKGNFTWRQAESGGQWLLVFSGADAYVSPSFYPSKQQTHEVVPTYNYISIQLQGTLRTSHERSEKLRTVEALTRRMESSRTTPWAVADAPAAYIERMLEGIVALEFQIAEITAKVKASQNRTPQDQRGVLEGLGADSATAEAASIIARRLGL